MMGAVSSPRSYFDGLSVSGPTSPDWGHGMDSGSGAGMTRQLEDVG